MKVRVLQLVFRFLRSFLRVFPNASLIAFCGTLGVFVGKFLSRDRRIARSQLRFAFPDGDPRRASQASRDVDAEHEALLDDVFRHLGQSVGESLIVDRLFDLQSGSSTRENAAALGETPRFVHFDSNGQDLAYEIIRRGEGAVGLSGHIGSFELLATFLVNCGIPMSVIGRLPNSPTFAGVLEELRRGYGVDTIWRDDPASMRKLITALKEGRFIAALIDQDSNMQNGFADYFGLPAASPIVLVNLAIKRRLPLFSSFIYRRGPLDHYVETQLIEYDSDSPTAAVDALSEYNRRLEDLVRRYPEQSLWWHRRWRRRPGIDYAKQPEELRSTREYIQWIEMQAQ